LQGRALKAVQMEQETDDGAQQVEVPLELVEQLLQAYKPVIQRQQQQQQQEGQRQQGQEEQQQPVLPLLPKEEFVCQLVQCCCEQRGEKLVVFSQVGAFHQWWSYALELCCSKHACWSD
jgi:hypothetical protein